MNEQSSQLEQTAFQIKTMLDMQNAMNLKVHPEWITQDFAWYRAIWVECAEMLDHYGWKWWKHQTIDQEQVKLELVDIFHFGLSLMLLENTDTQALAIQISNAMEHDHSAATSDFRAALEQVASQALVDKSFAVKAFAACMHCMDFSLDDLYRHYIGKNTLNFFRQDHGYKDGSYQKVWQDREDNEHLSEIINALDSNHSHFGDNVYKALAERYSATI